MCFDSKATEVVQVPEGKPILAYRKYLARRTEDYPNGVLAPLFRDGYTERVAQATCPIGHDAPQMHCQCGLHADATVEAARDRDTGAIYDAHAAAYNAAHAAHAAYATLNLVTLAQQAVAEEVTA